MAVQREGTDPIPGHPLGGQSSRTHRTLFWCGLGLVLVAVWGLYWLDPRPASGSAAELFASDRLEGARRILDGWAAADVDRATWWLVVDLAFAPVYATVLALACLWPLRRPSYPVARAFFGWAAVAGGLADWVETAALIVFLRGDAPAGAFRIARVAFWFKWIGVALAAAAGVAVLSIAVLRWFWGKTSLPPDDPGLERLLSARESKAQASSSTLVAQVAESAIADPSPSERLRAWFFARRREPQVDPPEPAVRAEGVRLGICCSGGGIRSAAYNLGALQELDRAGELGRAEYLAAVSGGSYIAAAYEIVRARSDPSLLDPMPPFAPGSPEEEHLRNRTTYLAPGLAGAWALVWRVLRGLIVNLFAIGGIVVLAAFLYGGLVVGPHLLSALECRPKRGCLPRFAPPVGVWWLIGLVAAAALAMGVWVLLARPRRDAVTRFLEGWSLRLLNVALLLVVLLLVIPWIVPEALEQGFVVSVSERARTYRVNLDQAAAAVAGWAAALGAAAGALGLRSLGVLGREPKPAPGDRARSRGLWARVKTYAFRTLLAVVGPLLVAFVFAVYVFVGAMQGTTLRIQWRMVVVGVLLAGVLGFGDLTRWSLHPFYKRRLSSAFVVERKRLPKGRGRGPEGKVVATEVPYDELVRFTDLRSDGPELVVCAAANVSDQGATPPSRSAVSITMSRSRIFAGRLFGGWLRMAHYESAVPSHERDITVPTAVAISGAAISPSMGKHGRRWLRFLLAIANVRLGVWLPNPRAVRRQLAGGRPVRPRAGPRYLLWELLGRNSYLDEYIYVTDGGHVENLGLVELLRRGCTEIYCFDASGDETDTFNTLGEALALARSELGVEIEIDPFVMAPPPGMGFAPTDHVVGHIWFAGDRDAGREPGHLVVAKVCVTADAPADVRAFMQRDPEFPTHGTASQLYTEERFEAYRALGAHTARRAILTMRAQGGP